MKPKVVSFDFDGTLSYMDPPVHITITRILERHGVRVNPGRVSELRYEQRENVSRHPLLGNKGWGLLTKEEQDMVLADGNRLLLKKLGIRSNLDFLANAINNEWFAERRLYQDVPEGFERLKEKGIHIAILAGPSSTAVKPILESQGLLSYVTCFATSDIISPKYGPLRKVDGTAFRFLLEEMKTQPSEAIHVGDNPQLDGDVPESLGIVAVLINRPDKEGVMEASRIRHMVQDMSELLDLIIGLGRQDK